MKKMATIVILMTLSSLAMADKIYKWVDENGQIHYSSHKPKNQEAESLKVQKGPKVTAKEDEQDPQSSETSEDSEADAQARAQLAKADAVNKRRLCDQARKNLAALNATVRVNRIDEKTGETVRMTDDQRVAALKNAQRGIKEYCN